MTFRASRRIAVAVLSTLLLVAAGCSSGKKSDKKKKKDKNLPPARVDLPDPPPASALKIPEKNSDGTFRVRGLIAHRGKHLGDKVEIKGTITYLSPDCDPAEAEKNDEECPRPHLFIQDAMDADEKMMVVGYDQKFVERADLEKEQEHVFKGTYKKLAQGFVATENGLLLLDAVGEEKVLEEEE